KRARTGEEMDENDEYIELPEVPHTPVITPAFSSKKGKGKIRKYKLRPARIEDLTKLDIVNYIRNLPFGLTIGQASAQYPKYRYAVRKSVQRRREANYVGEDSQTTTAARCDIYINNERLSAVVDSGAATSIMTKTLMDKLGYKINEPSKLTIVTANRSRIRYTRENQESSESSESSSSDEYESEDDLEEASIYYSETSSSDIEDLEYHPWRDYTSPPSPELEEELTSDEESEEELTSDEESE